MNLKKILEVTPAQSMMSELNDKKIVPEKRSYLGLSGIGTKCHRRLQLGHYDTFDTEHSARILRLFGVGHSAEDMIKKELCDHIGLIVFDDQKEVIGFSGHWKGHIDGLGIFKEDSKFKEAHRGVFLMEFKTHNDKSFADLKKNGVKASKPEHYDQMTSYMHHLIEDGLDVRKAMYVAYNKNTSEIYIEIIDYDSERAKDLVQKQMEVVMADKLLPRIGNDSPMWFECKYCDAKDVCFNIKELKKTCRNCQHADVMNGGIWSCSKGGDMKQLCPSYEVSEIICLSY